MHNKIVSCSHDRNAFVWTYDAATSSWKPALVILRIDRAALSVQWSADGLRFAVTSGAKCMPVCTYEAQNDWFVSLTALQLDSCVITILLVRWVSKTIKKKIKSTVTCCAFHPTNGQIIAAGSTDFKCCVFSTFSSDVDGTAVNAGPFPQPMEFGEVYAEMSCLGWVNAVAWSPSGYTLCFAGHDSSIHCVNFGADGSPIEHVVRYKDLPCNSLIFLTERSLLAAGHDFNPMLFTFNDSGSKLITLL